MDLRVAVDGCDENVDLFFLGAMLNVCGSVVCISSCSCIADVVVVVVIIFCPKIAQPYFPAGHPQVLCVNNKTVLCISVYHYLALMFKHKSLNKDLENL